MFILGLIVGLLIALLIVSTLVYLRIDVDKTIKRLETNLGHEKGVIIEPKPDVEQIYEEFFK